MWAKHYDSLFEIETFFLRFWLTSRLGFVFDDLETFYRILYWFGGFPIARSKRFCPSLPCLSLMLITYIFNLSLNAFLQDAGAVSTDVFFDNVIRDWYCCEIRVSIQRKIEQVNIQNIFDQKRYSTAIITKKKTLTQNEKTDDLFVICKTSSFYFSLEARDSMVVISKNFLAIFRIFRKI
jgi:hypothetical protein